MKGERGRREGGIEEGWKREINKEKMRWKRWKSRGKGKK